MNAIVPAAFAPDKRTEGDNALAAASSALMIVAYDEPMPVGRSRPIFEFSAGGLVVDGGGRVLLIRARDLRDQPVWTLPKGTLIAGETSAQAALREVREETGYDCELIRELDVVTYWFQRRDKRIKKTVRWFLMRPIAKVGEHDHEVDEVAWVDPGEASGRLRYDSDRRLVASVPAQGSGADQGAGNSRSPFL